MRRDTFPTTGIAPRSITPREARTSSIRYSLLSLPSRTSSSPSYLGHDGGLTSHLTPCLARTLCPNKDVLKEKKTNSCCQSPPLFSQPSLPAHACSSPLFYFLPFAVALRRLRFILRPQLDAPPSPPSCCLPCLPCHVVCHASVCCRNTTLARNIPIASVVCLLMSPLEAREAAGGPERAVCG